MPRRVLGVVASCALGILVWPGEALPQPQIVDDHVGQVLFDPPKVYRADWTRPSSVAAVDLDRDGLGDPMLDVVVGAADGLWTFENRPEPGWIGLLPQTRRHALVTPAPADVLLTSVVAIPSDRGSGSVALYSGGPDLVRIAEIETGLGGSLDPDDTQASESPIFTAGEPASRLVRGGLDMALSGEALGIAGSELSAVGGPVVGPLGDPVITLLARRTLEDRGRLVAIAALPGGRAGGRFAVTGWLSYRGERRAAVALVGLSTRTSELVLRTIPLALSPTSTETPVDIAVADLDADGSPEVVVLSHIDRDDEDGELDSGRLRIYDLGRAGIPLGTALVQRPGVHLHHGEPTALILEDISPPVGDESPETWPDLIVAALPPDKQVGARGRLVMHTFANGGSEAPGVFPFEGFEQRFELDEDTVDAFVTDMAAGFFDGNDTRDLVLADPASGRVILLPGQPPPCATVITLAIHGHRGGDSVFGVTTQASTAHMDAFVDEIDRIVHEDLNGARRDGVDQPNVCPLRSIGIKGHWEGLTEPGAFRHVLGRGFWLAAAMLPAPGCFHALAPPPPVPAPPPPPPPGVPPFPAPEPLVFWASSAFLLAPVPPPPPPPLFLAPGCIPGGPDPVIHGRFALATLGAVVEYFGARASNAASTLAAMSMANALTDAVSSARAEMPCDGQLYVDAAGYSRGGPVLSSTLGFTVHPGLDYNTIVTATYLDAIDPSFILGPGAAPGASCPLPGNGDSCRPWAKAGFIVNDPRVTRWRNEEKSNFFGSAASSLDSVSPPLQAISDAIESVVNLFPLMGQVRIPRDVIGLPIGYDRLPTFGSAGPTRVGAFGPFAMHDNIEQYFDATPTLADGPPGAPDTLKFYGQPPATDPGAVLQDFTVLKTTTLGDLIREPRSTPDGIGWTNGSAETESERFPEGCLVDGSTTTDDSDEAAAAAAAGASPWGSHRLREFVADHDFNQGRALVRSARWLVAHGRHALVGLFEDPRFEPLRRFLQETAAREYPADSVWRRHGDDVRLLGSGEEPLHETLLARTGESGVPVSADDGDGLEAVAAELAARAAKRADELAELAVKDPEELARRIHYSQRLISGAIQEGEAFARFGASASGLSQELAPASTLKRELIVRIALRFTSPSGLLGVAIEGPGLAATRVVSPAELGAGSRHELVYRVERDAAGALAGEPDELRIKGRHVELYSVSVRAERPRRHPGNGRLYELVVVEGGVDWEHARAVAQRTVFQGRKGQLAAFSDLETLEKALDLLSSDVPAWVGARSAPDGTGEFRWLDGTPVAAGFWPGGTTVPKEGFAYVDVEAGGARLGHSGPTATVGGRPVGFLIDYGPVDEEPKVPDLAP